ncbi:MAG TPA: MarR family transcriptional regulator [Terriglobales bacterium]|nr:MarR family transcriptional regulator [Terriglobales bacterium]
MKAALATSDYMALAELRYLLRRFLRFSEAAAHGAGLETRQHQFLLALKGLAPGKRPVIKELAERMQIRHHSAVELTNRLVARGYVERRRSPRDRREVLLSLTAEGEAVLRKLSLDHRAELRARGPALTAALQRITRK